MKTVLLFLLLSPVIVWAQQIKITPEDTRRKHSYLLMRDGSVVRGQIIRQDSSIITVKKRAGDMTFIEADQVVTISSTRPDESVRSGNIPATIFVLKDGLQVAGKFIRRDSTMITVQKTNGQLTYFEPELLVRVDTVQAKADVDSTIPVAPGNRTFPNRFSPWLLTGQTAYNPEKGRLYYRNTFLLLNEFQYGITRNWSIGVNLNPFFGSYYPENNPRETVLGATIRFNSKLTFPIGEQFRVGINAVYQPRQKGYFFGLNENLIIQGLMSFGDSQRNATLGYGMRVYSTNSPVLKIPFVSVGVMHKIARNLTFLSDNTFYLNSYSYYGGTSAELSVALRLNRRRHAFDLGALASVRPYYSFYYSPYPSSLPQVETRAYFSPYIAYNLIIGRK